MNTPKWLFFVLVFWVGATLWCNALEPSTTSLIPGSVMATVEGEDSMQDPSLTTAAGVTKIWDWVGNIWKALTFDYGIFESWLNIIRIICVLFSIASLYFIADIIWKIRSILLGQ